LGVYSAYGLAAEKLTLDITVLGLFQQAESNSGFIFWLTKQQFQEFWNLKKNVIARINLNAVGVPKALIDLVANKLNEIDGMVLDFPSLEVWSILKSLTNVLAELLQANLRILIILMSVFI